MIASLLALTTGTVQQAPTQKVAEAVSYRSEKRFGEVAPEKGFNTCSFAFDGDCDDGGTGSHYSTCSFGTDSADCGDDSCAHRRDGDCDDGGPGSEFGLCALNTDRTDCFSRRGYGHVMVNSMCTNTCISSRDGDCDDGGWGSEYSLCHVGTDCRDCGSRSFNYLRAEADAIDQAQWPSLREQKTAKTLNQGRKMQKIAVIGGVTAVGVLLAVGILVKRRQQRPANAKVVPDAPTMM